MHTVGEIQKTYICPSFDPCHLSAEKAQQGETSYLFLNLALSWFPFSQLQPRQRPILNQNKEIRMKDDCSVLESLCLCLGRGI